MAICEQAKDCISDGHRLPELACSALGVTCVAQECHLNVFATSNPSPEDLNLISDVTFERSMDRITEAEASDRLAGVTK